MFNSPVRYYNNLWRAKDILRLLVVQPFPFETCLNRRFLSMRASEWTAQKACVTVGMRGRIGNLAPPKNGAVRVCLSPLPLILRHILYDLELRIGITPNYLD